MNYTIRFAILILILQFNKSGVAQDAHQCLKIARDLYNIGEYEDAISMYRRVLYFNNELAVDSYFNIGESYLATKQFNQARYYFSLAENRESSDSIKTEIRFRTIASYILEGKLLFAKNELLGFEPHTSLYFDKKLNFYLGIVEFKLHNIEDAEQFLIQVFDKDLLADLKQLIAKGKKIANKKPGTALAMSAIIPGAGQGYGGDWADAANSFFLNLVTTTLYIYIWAEYSYLDAVMAVLPWWHRYYVGGFMNARDLIRDTKDEQLDLVLTDILLLYSLVFEEE